jgi:hypothetical protein
MCSAWQGISQEFLSEILALQVEVATLHGAACRLDLIRPDLWRTLRYFPRPLDITGLGRQLDSVCCCNFVTIVDVLRGFGTGHFSAAYRMLRTWRVIDRLLTGYSHGVATPLWPPPAYALFGLIV